MHFKAVLAHLKSKIFNHGGRHFFTLKLAELIYSFWIRPRSQTIISARKLKTQNQNKIASCLPVKLPKINGYGVTTTTIITESKTDLILLPFKQRGEL